MSRPTPRGAGASRSSTSTTPVRRPAAGARPPTLGQLPVWFTERALPSAIAITIGLLSLGFLVGCLGAFAHATRVAGLPVGLVVAVLAEGAVVATSGVFTASRSGAALPGVGWLLSTLMFAAESPAGGLIIAGDPVGTAYLLGGVLLFPTLTVLPYGRFAAPVRAMRG